MKKLILILVGLVLVLAICSCTDNGKEELKDGTSVETTADANEKNETVETEPATASPNPENDPYWTENY